MDERKLLFGVNTVMLTASASMVDTEMCVLSYLASVFDVTVVMLLLYTYRMLSITTSLVPPELLR